MQFMESERDQAYERMMQLPPRRRKAEAQFYRGRGHRECFEREEKKLGGGSPKLRAALYLLTADSRYNEIDPTAFVAITFTLLFGIMFGDLGQGILVAVIGWAMWHFKQMPIGRILLPCGISSAVFGLVYGSVFGFEHVLDPMYKALFGLEEKPIEVMNSAMATNIILFAVVIGLTLIMLAMMLNIYSGWCCPCTPRFPVTRI